MKAQGRWALGPHECQLRGVRGPLPQGQGAPSCRRNTPWGRLLLLQGAELGQRGWEGIELGDPVPDSRLVHHFP